MPFASSAARMQLILSSYLGLARVRVIMHAPVSAFIDNMLFLYNSALQAAPRRSVLQRGDLEECATPSHPALLSQAV